MTGIEALLPWSNLTPSAILGVMVVFIMLGWIVPRWFYTQVAKERDHWRSAHEKSESGRTIAIRQVEVLVGAVDKMAGQKDLGATLIQSVKADEEHRT